MSATPSRAPLELSDLFRLDGRTAIVTGASSGLGDRFARVLHAAGATVVVAARRAERLAELAADLGDRVLAVPADLSVEADRERLIAAAFELDGRLDVLVNNAGASRPVPAESETLSQFDAALAINLVAPFHLSQLAARHMLAAGTGSIVNIASILGLVASAPMKDVTYCASKGAVVNMTRQLGCEWGRKGVRVNAIAPGWFPSEMTQAEMFDDEGGAQFVARNTPMGRPGTPDELDGALLYLAGPASSYVTGQVLTVDGGWTAR